MNDMENKNNGNEDVVTCSSNVEESVETVDTVKPEESSTEVEKSVEEKKDDNKNHKVRNTVLAVIAVIVIILLLLRFCGNQSVNITNTEPAKQTVEESVGFNDSGEEVEETQPEVQEAATVNYILNSTVVIEGNKISGLGLENNNDHRYVRAVYKLNDETVYDSKLIDCDGKIDTDNIVDGFNLPAPGSYETIVEMYSYDFDQQMRGQTNFEITIVVQ